MVPSSLGALCPRTVARGTLVRGLVPTGYKLMRRVSQKQKGSALDLLNKRNGNFNGKRGDQKERTTQLHLQRNGGTPLLLGRAFAVTPSRLPARPSGLRGLTAQRGQAKGLPCHQCRTELARALSHIGREEMLIAKKLLYTPGPHISCKAFTGCSWCLRLRRLP